MVGERRRTQQGSGKQAAEMPTHHHAGPCTRPPVTRRSPHLDYVAHSTHAGLLTSRRTPPLHHGQRDAATLLLLGGGRGGTGTCKAVGDGYAEQASGWCQCESLAQ